MQSGLIENLREKIENFSTIGFNEYELDPIEPNYKVRMRELEEAVIQNETFLHHIKNVNASNTFVKIKDICYRMIDSMKTYVEKGQGDTKESIDAFTDAMTGNKKILNELIDDLVNDLLKKKQP